MTLPNTHKPFDAISQLRMGVQKMYVTNCNLFLCLPCLPLHFFRWFTALCSSFLIWLSVLSYIQSLCEVRELGAFVFFIAVFCRV